VGLGFDGSWNASIRGRPRNHERLMKTLRFRNDQLSNAASRGYDRLASNDWSGSSAVEDFLALMALRCVLAGYLVGDVSRTTSAEGKVTIDVVLDGRKSVPERAQAARALIAPLGAYGDLAGLEFATQQTDTGAIPIAVLIAGGVVAVSVVIAQSYVLMNIADKAAQVVDGALRRKDASQEIQNADAEVVKLVNNHIQREQNEGKALPLDAATKAAISGLETRVGSLVKSSFESAAYQSLPKWVWPTVGVSAVAVVTAIFITIRSIKNG
jgi:hypothetical protein